MRPRRWIGVLAMLGVLLHAGALVRHHGVMLGALLQYEALVSDLAAVCHGGADSASRSLADLPSIPKPSEAQNGCPVCSGQSPAYVVVAPEPLAVAAHDPAPASWHFLAISPAAHLHAVCPPARGPPALA